MRERVRFPRSPPSFYLHPQTFLCYAQTGMGRHTEESCDRTDWRGCQCHLCKGHEWPFHCGCGAVRRYDSTLTWCSDSRRHREWELKRDGRDVTWLMTGTIVRLRSDWRPEGMLDNIREFSGCIGVVLGHPYPDWPEWEVCWEPSGLRYCYPEEALEPAKTGGSRRGRRTIGGLHHLKSRLKKPSDLT